MKPPAGKRPEIGTLMSTPVEPERPLGQIAYEVYARTYNRDRTLTPWLQLSELIRECWSAAGMAVVMAWQRTDVVWVPLINPARPHPDAEMMACPDCTSVRLCDEHAG